MEFSLDLNADYIDSMYRLWKSDPGKVGRDWRIFFEGFELAGGPSRETAAFCPLDRVLRQARAQELIHRYRDIGHLMSCLDPLASCPVSHPLLDLAAFGLSDDDLDADFHAPHTLFKGEAPLREIVKALKETYCRSVGVEYMHLQDPDERLWLQERIEPTRNKPALDGEVRLRMLNKLCQAASFERFLHTKYIGQKRFSVEGAEAAIAMLDALIRIAAERGCREVILGMAHRGRLNVRVNVLDMPYEMVFCEFEESYDPESLVGSGDVKYHKGYMTDMTMPGGRSIRIVLASNPSHLEAVDPVVEGIARARQERIGDAERAKVIPVLIHGDAAFAGQGTAAETLNLSQLEGYRTGGTVHIVINNQIGFTTTPEHARSTRYSTDVAKMLMVPIFHVHGEDPDAAAHIVKLAFDYRMLFKKDVVIDLVCYRRYGHNEGDEPYYTQPGMYDRIKDRPQPWRIYADKLIAEGLIVEDDVARIGNGVDECLEIAFRAAKEKRCVLPEPRFFEEWDKYGADDRQAPVETGAPKDALVGLARKMSVYPKGFSVHRKLERILTRRLDSVEKGEGIDWATAEHLAFASLLVEGVPVRLSGQDARRGTFSQRHSVLTDPETGESYTPLNRLTPDQAPFMGFDSMLSESAVMGFEYGYSIADPEPLVLWEAQFGDFANNAQAVIDQFISSGEAKWRRPSGLTLLLPHGLEGQGAEHSSARPERFLQLCAEDNMRVCNPTTPAQYFHLLRRQVKRRSRKPLIVFTPKSLLRHPAAVSRLDDLAAGGFLEVIGEVEPMKTPERVLICSGKIYYELAGRRKEVGNENTLVFRIEQFYPFPDRALKELAAGVPEAGEWFWVQEEPRNTGGWTFVRDRLEEVIGRKIGYIGRPESAAPATGYHGKHAVEQSGILTQAIPSP